MKSKREHEVALIITGDGKGGVKAVRANREELDKLTQQQEKGKKKTEQYGKAHKNAEKDISGFGKVVQRGAQLVTAAAAATTAALTAMYNSRSRAVEESVNQAQALGISSEAFMGQAYAASFLGIETQKYGDILRDTTVRVQEFAAMGTGAAADFFEIMKVDVQELAKLKPDELMRRIGDEIKDLNQNQRIMFLDQLGSQDAVLLGNIITQLDQMESEARAIGVALSDVDAQMLADSVAGLTRMEGVATGAANQISVGLAPIVSDLTDRLYQAAVEAGGLESAVDSVLTRTIELIGVPLDGFQRWRQLQQLVVTGWLDVGATGANAMAANAEATAIFINAGLQPVAELLSWITNNLANMMGAVSQVGGPIGRMAEGISERLDSFSDSLGDFEVSADGIVAIAEDMSGKALKAHFEYLAILAEPPASEELADWYEKVKEKAEEMARAQVEANESVEAGGPVFDRANEAIEQMIADMEFENSLMSMGNLERQIQTNLRRLDANATDEQRAAVRRLTTERYNQEQALKREAEQAKLTGEIRQNQIENVQKALGDLTQGFLSDGKLKWGEFFDYIIDGWNRVYSEFVSKNFTELLFGGGSGGGFGSLFGGGSGSGQNGQSGGFSLGSIAGGISNLLGLDRLPGILTGATDMLGNLIGYEGTALMGPTQNGSQLTAGLSERLPQGWDILKSAGYSMLGGFAGNEIGEALFGKQAESRIGATIGGALGSLVGPLGSGIGAALGSLVDVATGGDGKERYAAGMLVGPTPSAENSQYAFDVDPFASGLQVIGTARRVEQETAREVIDIYRTFDAASVDLFKKLGVILDLSSATLGGLDEEATPGSAGTFMGLGGNGELTGDIPAQLMYYFEQMLDHASGLSDELMVTLRSATSAEEALAILNQAVVDKQRSDEQAAQTEEAAAAAAESLRVAEERLLQQRIGLASDMANELNAIRSLRQSISMDVSSLLGASPLFEIDATITDQIASIQEQRQHLLRTYDEQIAAQQRLHEESLAAAQGLTDVALQLRLGDTSTMSGADQLALIQQEFRNTLQAAMGGDTDAANRLRELAQSYAQESQYMYASGEVHQANMNEILNGLDSAAEVMAGGTGFDADAAQAQLLAALRDLDQQLMSIASGVNDKVIDELKNIRVVLEELSPQMQDALLGAVSEWVETSSPGGMEIIEALGGIEGSVDSLPPEIAAYLSSAMGSLISSMKSRGAHDQVIADGISQGGLDESAADKWLGDQGLGSVDDYRSAYNPDVGANEIRDQINAITASSATEAEALTRAYEAAVAAGVGSKQIADAMGVSQTSILDAITGLGLQSFNGGGIASGPASGYPVMMHGIEAVVPLDRGAIPVRLDTTAANDAVVRHLQVMSSEFGSMTSELSALRKDMRSGMAYAASQRDQLRSVQQESRDEVRRLSVGGGGYGSIG